MLHEPTTLAMAIHLLADALREEYGVDPQPVFSDVGIDLQKEVSPQCRYPLSQMRELWAATVELTGDPTVGLRTGWHARPASFYAFGFSWMASETLLEGLKRLCRYGKIVSTASFELSLRELDDTYALSEAYPDEAHSPPREGIDAGMTALLRLCDIVAEKRIRPVRVELVCDDNVHPEAYREHLGAPIRYGFDIGTFYFDKATLEEPLPSSTPDVAKATDKISEQYLETLDPHEVASHVRRLLVSLLPSGNADQDLVARHLNRSTSTLQRQLQGEGLSYRAVLDNTRQTLAEEYLRQGKLSHAQVAYLLGFSDQSNFSRAFKRWTKQSPRQFQSKSRGKAA